METWHDTSGITWVHRDHPEPQPGRELAGVVLGRGHAHQHVAELGMATTAAAVLARELSRPIESGTGQVLEVRVQVDVGLQDTLVALLGEPEALRRSLVRLDGLLRDPAEVDLTPPDRPGTHPFAQWSRHLAAWFGVGPASLSTTLDPPWRGDPERLRRALADLHPRRTTAVGFTTVAELVGTAFAEAGDEAPLAPQALTWRPRGPGSVAGCPVEQLLSLRSGRGAAALLAERLVLTTVANALAVEGGTEGVAVTTSTVGDSRLVVARARLGQGQADPAGLRRAVLEAVEAARGLDADLVERSVTAYRDDFPTSTLHPVDLALEAVRSGRRREGADLAAEHLTVTTEQVRAELERTLDRVQLALPAGAEAPSAFPLVDLRGPDAPPPAEPSGRRHVHTMMSPIATGDGVSVLARLERRGSRLTSVGRGEKSGREHVVDAIDLDRVVLRIDQGDPDASGTTVLVDDGDHRVRVSWWALRGRRGLRRAVAAAVPADLTLRLPEQPEWTAAADRQRRRARIALTVAGVVLAVGGAAAAYGVLSGEPDDDATLADLARGEQGLLANGTAITVSDVRLQPGEASEVVLASVRFCGGGPTTVDGEASTARDYVAPGRFSLDGIASAPLPAYPDGVEPLRDTTLGDGECLDGTVGFQVPAGTQDVGIGVRYTNLLGDQLTWRAEGGS